MIRERKKIEQSDYLNMISGNSVVLGLKFDNKNDVVDIIEKFKNEIIGLNLRAEDQFYVKRKKEEIHVYRLPPSSDFKSLQELTKFSAYKHIPDINHELGTISANDDTIVLNLNHSISDGKYIAGVANHIGDHSKNMNDFYFPLTFDDEFSEEIKERLKSPPKFYDCDTNNTIFTKFGMERVDREILHDSLYDVKKFANYDQKTKKCKNLTASIITGYSLSLSALEGMKNITHLGGSLAVDMRNTLKEKKINHIQNILCPNSISKNSKSLPDSITINHTNFFTIIPVAVPVNPMTTIDDCYKQINQNIRTHTVLHKEDLFDLRCSMGFENPKEKSNGVMVGFSNLGPVHIRPPVKDLYIFNLDFNIVFPYIILFTYSIIDEKSNRNDFHAQVRYECNGLTKDQSNLLSKLFQFYLQTFKPNQKISDAFDELKEFQKTVKL